MQLRFGRLPGRGGDEIEFAHPLGLLACIALEPALFANVAPDRVDADDLARDDDRDHHPLDVDTRTVAMQENRRADDCFAAHGVRVRFLHVRGDIARDERRVRTPHEIFQAVLGQPPERDVDRSHEAHRVDGDHRVLVTLEERREFGNLARRSAFARAFARDVASACVDADDVIGDGSRSKRNRELDRRPTVARYDRGLGQCDHARSRAPERTPYRRIGASGPERGRRAAQDVVGVATEEGEGNFVRAHERAVECEQSPRFTRICEEGGEPLLCVHEFAKKQGRPSTFAILLLRARVDQRRMPRRTW